MSTAASSKLSHVRLPTRSRAQSNSSARHAVISLRPLPPLRDLEQLVDPGGAQGNSGSTLFALLFVHITNLKQIQIAFGREAGDEVLRHVIEQTRGSLRVADILFGDANDELIALLHATDTSTAENIASRIRVKIAEPVALATG